MKGRTYRRCACRDDDGRQLGARCPELTNARHGRWSYAVDVPSVDGRRKTVRRSGFATKGAAVNALDDLMSRYRAGVRADDRERVAAFLTAWLAGRRHTLRPKTLHTYTRVVDRVLVPALGHLPLEQLHHDHVAALVTELEAEGRGASSIRQAHAVLSSALGDAVRQRRLAHNPAEHVALPRAERAERQPWSAAELARFFEACVGDRLAELFVTIAGTGLRRGEALGLQWRDVDLDGRVLVVRRVVGDVGGRLTVGQPKTKGSAAGVGLSPLVVAALGRQAERQDEDRAAWGAEYGPDGWVFAREDGSPLRPEAVLRSFHDMTTRAGLRRSRVHDLRHAAATLMLTSGVPLALVSKTLRHSTVSITSDLYGHLTREAAVAAADTLGTVLDAAASELAGRRAGADATTPRPLDLRGDLLIGAGAGVPAGEGWSRLSESNRRPAHYE